MPIAFVQQAGNDATAASVTATFGSAVTSGNVVIAMVGCAGSGNVTVSVSGLTGATWASVVDSDVQAQGHKAIWIGSGFSGGTQVTVTPSAAARTGIIVAEFSGLSTTGDGTNSAGGNSTTPATGNITTTNANDLIVAMFLTFGGNTITGDPPTGFTALTQRTTDVSEAADYQIVSSTGTFSGTWVILIDNWEALIASFRASGGAAAVMASDDVFLQPSRRIFPIANPLKYSDVMVPTVTLGKSDDRNVVPTHPIFRIPTIPMWSDTVAPTLALGKSDDKNLGRIQAVFRTPLIPSWSDTVVPTVTLGKIDDLYRPILVRLRFFPKGSAMYDVLAFIQPVAGVSPESWQWQVTILG